MSVRRQKATRSIFNTVMRPMLALLVVEALLLTLVLIGSNVVGELNRNRESIADTQVENRGKHLSTTLNGWADMSRLTDILNSAVQKALDSGELTLEDLDGNSEACSALLLRVTDDLITTLYAKRINGIFLVFNTQDLSNISDNDPIPPKVGVCIRDMDPLSAPSERNEDLLWERSPISVVKTMDIATDTNWQPLFTFPEDQPYESRAFFLEPLRAAFREKRITDISDFGYWEPSHEEENATTQHGTTYSLPLMLGDGTIYGVVGVHIMDAYVGSLLPYEEMLKSGDGSYILVLSSQKAEELSMVEPKLIFGKGDFTRGEALYLEKDGEGYRYTAPNGVPYYVTGADIPLYNKSSPFIQERWVLLGAIPAGQLYAFGNRLALILAGAVIAMLLGGVAASYIAGKRMSNPIQALSSEVRLPRGQDSIPDLSRTGILEIDQFSEAITTLSRNVLDASSRFLQIIRLASVELGGFEIREEDNSVFVTDNFFSMFGMLPIPQEEMSVSLFREIMDSLDEELPTEKRDDQSTLYTVASIGGTQRYIRVKVIDLGTRQVGVAEDVTSSILERMRVEHERDYDLLTGLYNRRAFYSQAVELFSDPAQLGHGALLMMDLDNLKYINDHYGHAFGDKYLRQAGQCFVENSPEGTLCARVSGDEFYLLFYGYESQSEIRQELKIFYNSMRASCYVLPSGKKMEISASGGVSWYPEDSQDFGELMRYADYAMYQAKRSKKGSMREFDRGGFNKEAHVLRAHSDFRKLISEQLVRFHFQPIVDSRSGEVRGYEALMRTDFPSLRSPGEVLRVAKEINMLREVECLTMLNAPIAYKKLLREGKADREALLFVNSLSNQSLTPEVEQRYIAEAAELRPRLVVELTESEDMTAEALQEKIRLNQGRTPFALDDYGTGYNSERNLLILSPKYIKVDMAIIRGIDEDANKQHIVSNIVSYGHERDMIIIAEGIETMAELNKVLELGVDMLQGFLLVRPAEIPGEVPEEIRDSIRAFWEQREKSL